MIVSVWCGAARFVHADITRLDATQMQTQSYRWSFAKVKLPAVTLDLDSTVLTRWGSQNEGGAKGYNPKHHGRASHHPLLAFVADWRLAANFWLRPGDTGSANNAQSFIEATLASLGATPLGLFRADSGFYNQTIVSLLKTRNI